MSRFIDAVRRWLHRRRMARLIGLKAETATNDKLYVGVDLAKHPDYTAGPPLVPVARSEPIKLPDPHPTLSAIESQAREVYGIPPQLDISIDDEMLECVIDSFRSALRICADIWQQIANSISQLDEDAVIVKYAYPGEIHRMYYARKARTRKKYKNRILRRERRAMKKEDRP